MIRSFDAGEERQEGMGNMMSPPQGETAPETTGGTRPRQEETSFPPV